MTSSSLKSTARSFFAELFAVYDVIISHCITDAAQQSIISSPTDFLFEENSRWNFPNGTTSRLPKIAQRLRKEKIREHKLFLCFFKLFSFLLSLRLLSLFCIFSFLSLFTFRISSSVTESELGTTAAQTECISASP
jgi:hypothetical protein